MSNFVCEDVDGGEACGGVGPAHHVRSAKLGYDTGVRGQTHAAHRRQAHRDAVAPPALLREEVQPGTQNYGRSNSCCLVYKIMEVRWLCQKERCVLSYV